VEAGYLDCDFPWFVQTDVQNGLKQLDALFVMLFDFALEYAIGKIQGNHVELKLNGTHQLLAFADFGNR
jgi:hypothetical protein